MAAFLTAAALTAVTAGGGVAWGSQDRPPDDRLLPADQHMSPKARQLALKHGPALKTLNAHVYFCMPWLEVAPESIGFFKPRHVTDDQRYLSLRAYIEQRPSVEFAALTLEERAAAMFSRYVGSLLRQMAGPVAILNDDAIDGFTVILEWLKQIPARGARPVNETIAVFVDKVDADDFLAGRATVRELAARSRTLAWDGARLVGAVRLAPWDDDFLTTYRVTNYAPPAGVTCR